MNSCGLTIGISVLANALADNLTDNELGLLSTVFSQLGDTLATILAQRVLCDSSHILDSSNNFIKEFTTSTDI